MTPEKIKVVQDSYMRLKMAHRDPADIFYERLFDIAPEVRGLFPTDIEEQKMKFSMTLDSTMLNLKNLSILVPSIKALGQRHKDYGVTLDHFGPVKTALFWTLENILAEHFSKEVREAWLETYNTLEKTMMQGMNEKNESS